MPRVAIVSLVQYVAAGVPARSHAALQPNIVLERYWIYTSLGVLFQFVSIAFEIVYPWFFFCISVARCAASADSRQSIFPFRLPFWISTLSLHC